MKTQGEQKKMDVIQTTTFLDIFVNIQNASEYFFTNELP